MPFFLFTGVLVPRIYAQAAAYAAQHPELEVVAGAHLGPDRRLARLVLERYREALTGDVRMNCDLCTYRVRLPGYEDKVGTPISLTPHGDGPARGSRRSRRATRARRAEAARRCGPRRPSSRAPTILRVEDLAVRVSGRHARRLAACDCACEPGERVAMLGPNGAGKTTLALAACGALEDADGHGARSAGRRSRARPAARSAAAPGSSSRTPTTSSSCRPSRRTSPSARPTRG